MAMDRMSKVGAEVFKFIEFQLKALPLCLIIEQMNDFHVTPYLQDLSGSTHLYKHWYCAEWDRTKWYACCGKIAEEGPCAGHCEAHCRWYREHRPLHLERGGKSEKAWDNFYRIDMPQHAWDCHGRLAPKEVKTYAFTLTTDGDEAEKEAHDMSVALTKLYTQKSVPVYEGEAYLEYTKAGRPHIHGWYVTESGGRIWAKIFQRCWPKWGESREHPVKFAGGYHEQMKHNRYKDYAAVEGRRILLKKKNEDIVIDEKVYNEATGRSEEAEASAEAQVSNEENSDSD